MYKGKTILGLITARGGSRGIPRKNIKKLGDKPLIVYTIEAGKASQYLDRVVVSTDDQEIADISRQFGADIPFMRPIELAGDKSTSIEVAQHAISWLKEREKQEFDYLMILQPTSPLRTIYDIDESIKKIVETGADSLMGMMELVDFSVKKIKRIDNDLIMPWFTEEGQRSASRQDLKKVYKRNCAIYLTRVDLIMRGDLFGKVSRPHIMSAERSVDINTPFDFELAEFLIRKKLNK
ncbi:acylneuraminate cytidylyltransferase family protein [Patescibacteria group bacterium]|nr:acylneuraminate cytidylyltransferase family protein [Patescibacteria group bacterium]MBU1922011.1 acylneuraminate cytidylyltransferase family protein [Patescibacteria group bacterium]